MSRKCHEMTKMVKIIPRNKAISKRLYGILDLLLFKRGFKHVSRFFTPGL